MRRKLAAILSADVVGFSGQMEADEAGTLERLKANRARIFDPHVAAHGGRQFKLMGDGALVEFSSIVSAVECALAIQEASETAAAGAADGERIRYRIGINLGDVMIEGDDIYGEGVNVAARLETLASPGGIAISRVAKEQIEGKLRCSFEDMGEHQVKSHERPVHAFAVRHAAARAGTESYQPQPAQKLSICVLPFANMSDDPQQEYFSDGISEDIITDLSKVSALFVVSRNSAFTFKGRSVDIPKVARDLKVSHVLEGSVRKAGGRVRITAQLIDGASNGHVWAERYDRDLNDIFALQDEISEAIVNALKLKLLPEEKKAIERRGTDSAEAYNLYLMARQNYVVGGEVDSRRATVWTRICSRATEIDPDYARAWSLMALGQMILCIVHGKEGDDGLISAERALALDPRLAEAHAVKARILSERGRSDEADPEIDIALDLDAESYEVNRAAAYLSFRKSRMEDAVRYYEKALTLMDSDASSPSMLITCYTALDNPEASRRNARITLERSEKMLAQDPNNSMASGFGAIALAVMGENERAKEWMERALLIEPDNMNMRYNFACSLVNYIGEMDLALDLLEPVFAKLAIGFVNHAKVDPDMDKLRDLPRFKAMLAAAEARVAEAQKKDSSLKR